MREPVVVAAALVEVEQLVAQDPLRPAVPQHEVVRDHEAVAAVAEAHDEHPQQRRPGEVEAPRAVGGHQLAPGARAARPASSAPRSTTSIGVRGSRATNCTGWASPSLDEARAQARVARQQRRARRAQPLDVDAAQEVQRGLRGVDVELAVVERGVEVQALLQRRQAPDVLDRPGSRAATIGRSAPASASTVARSAGVRPPASRRRRARSARAARRPTRAAARRRPAALKPARRPRPRRAQPRPAGLVGADDVDLSG